MPVESPKQTSSNEQDKKVVNDIKSVAKTGLSGTQLDLKSTKEKVAQYQVKNAESLAPESDNQTTKSVKIKNHSSGNGTPDKVVGAMS